VSEAKAPGARREGAISVVISTYQRPDACERAIRSVLDQRRPPLEVLVCDNGSLDETGARIRRWERRDPRVRYLRTERNSGTPATTRNLGIEHARGDLIAFLDDDDEWLPGKLAAQMDARDSGFADVIATNAVRSSDERSYFPEAPPVWCPTRLELLRANPVICSSALVPRDALRAVGGFPTDLRLRGLEDYAAWLELAGRGVRFAVLGEPLVRYQDAAGDRLSLARARIQLAVARLTFKHAFRAPVTAGGMRAALGSAAAVVHVVGAEALNALRPPR
jgi:glycosyltransferase involved in cell wall biosynthesis